MFLVGSWLNKCYDGVLRSVKKQNETTSVHWCERISKSHCKMKKYINLHYKKKIFYMNIYIHMFFLIYA